MIEFIESKLRSLPTLDDQAIQDYLSLLNKESKGKIIQSHHILPRALFPEFKSFKLHPWNKIRLSLEDHLRAHYYLSKAYQGKMSQAFAMMTNFHGVEIFPNGMLEELEYARERHRMIVIETGRITMTNLNKDPEFREKINRSIRSEETKLKKRENEIQRIEKGIHPFQKQHNKIKVSQINKLRMESGLNPGKGEKSRIRLSQRNLLDNPMKNDAIRLKMIETKKNAPVIQCPHCLKEGKGGNMKRYHFDNCKLKEKF